MVMPSNVQWFPLFSAKSGPFTLNKQPSGALGATANVSIELDTFPELVYGARFEVSYELPDEFFNAHLDWKQLMREGGVDDDYTVEIKFTQQNVTGNEPSHVRNLQGGLSINKHPWPLPYALRGGNKIQFIARRNSSYPTITVDDVVIPLAPIWYVTIEAARGVQDVADGVSSPAPPGSTGWDGQ